ncbi:MAG: peptide-methionine (S)-S-oxide reductase MsrA [Xanthobacteraceae bacterium]
MACRISPSLRLPRGTLLYTLLGAVVLTAIFVFAKTSLTQAAESAVVIPPPAVDAGPSANGAPRSIVLAGGCFWGVQAVYQHTKGVTQAVSGYAGGKKDTAHYEMVGTGSTGHAESVQVTFDPKEITLGKILQIYFSVAHNPTELNYQGPDSGTQYRSEIFYTDQEQKRVAEAYIAQLDKAHVFAEPIATKVGPLLTGFYPAETYHQDFAVLHPTYPYIVFNDLPKVDNLKRLFPDYYRETPVTVLASSRPTQ